MRYVMKDGVTYTFDPKQGQEMIANFTASITQETEYKGGLTPEKTLTLIGEAMRRENDKEPEKLPPITMSDTEFASMGWPLKYWGTRCIILPGGGNKDDMRTAIQLLSTPSQTSIYKKTGWEVIDGKRKFLHRGGAIGKSGNDKSVTVELPTELRYDLTAPDAEPKACVQASLALLDLAQHDLTWPLLAATLAPVYGTCDFAIHVTGRTGSFKSEVMSLCQSHYGAEMDSRHLPGSWTSSDNALEAMAFLAANCPFVIDDFVPHGSSWQQRTYQGKAERIFRAQGNQAGRQRLTDASNMQQTMFPRGIVLSTGEDTPEGHSVRGRMLIREIKPGDVSRENLSAAQANRWVYPGTIAWLVQTLAADPVDITERANAFRDELNGTGHSRTPSILGRLIAVVEDFLNRCKEAKFITEPQRRKYEADAIKSITAAGDEQNSFLETTDPVDIFIATLKQILAGGQGHVRSPSDGVPKNAEQLGWTSERGMDDSHPTYKAKGQCIGWASAKKNELWLEPTLTLTLVKKVAGAEIPLSKQTLTRRLSEAGKLARTDGTRQRLTCRVTAGNAVRQCLILHLSDVIEAGGVADGE